MTGNLIEREGGRGERGSDAMQNQGGGGVWMELQGRGRCNTLTAEGGGCERPWTVQEQVGDPVAASAERERESRARAKVCVCERTHV